MFSGFYVHYAFYLSYRIEEVAVFGVDLFLQGFYMVFFYSLFVDYLYEGFLVGGGLFVKEFVKVIKAEKPEKLLTEGVGFEPTEGLSTLKGFQIPRLRPLGHPSYLGIQ